MANMKVVEHKKLSNFHVGSFSSCLGKIKVILEILICPQFKNLNSFELSLIFKLFGQINLFLLRISLGHLNIFWSLQNFAQLSFWWKLGFSSSFGQISQKDKVRRYGLLQCSAGEGALPPGQSRLRARHHAQGHAAACCCASLDVLIRIAGAVAWIKPRVAGTFLFFSLNLIVVELPAPLQFASPVAVSSHLSTPAAPP